MIPGFGRSPGEGNGNPLLETWVQSLGWEDLLEKEMATHSSILGWRIPWTEEPGRLQFMESQRVGHNLATEQQQMKIYSTSLIIK